MNKVIADNLHYYKKLALISISASFIFYSTGVFAQTCPALASESLSISETKNLMQRVGTLKVRYSQLALATKKLLGVEQTASPVIICVADQVTIQKLLPNTKTAIIGVAVSQEEASRPQIYLSLEAIRSKNTEYYFVHELTHVLRNQFGRDVNQNVLFEEGLADFVAQSITKSAPFGAISAYLSESEKARALNNDLSLSDYGFAYLQMRYLSSKSNDPNWLIKTFRSSYFDSGWLTEMSDFVQRLIFLYYANPIYNNILEVKKIEPGVTTTRLDGPWSFAVYDVTRASRQYPKAGITDTRKTLLVKLLVTFDNTAEWLSPMQFAEFTKSHAIKKVFLVLINTGSEPNDISIQF